jgi:hypothetical protein
MHNVLKVRLQPPAASELHGVANLKEHFEIAHDRQTGINIGSMHLIGDASVG